MPDVDPGLGARADGVSPGAWLLDGPGTYRMTPADASGLVAGLTCELRIGRGWAALTAWAADDAPPETRPALAAAGLAPPRGEGSAMARAWFRSWSLRTAPDRMEATAEILAATRRVFRAGEETPVHAAPLPAYRGDPRAPITAVLGTIYLAYCLVAGWITLIAWDLLVPGRAHPAMALVAQVAGPLVSIVLFVGYVVGVPRVRLRWAASRRPPTPDEIDGQVPGITVLGLLAPPLVLTALLVLGGSG